MNIETVKQHFTKIEWTKQIRYIFPIYTYDKKFNIFSSLFLILFTLITFFYSNSKYSLILPVLIFAIFYLILFFFLIMPIKFYNDHSYEIFYKKSTDNILNFDQIKYFNYYNEYINNKKKYNYLKKKIFFISWLGNKNKKNGKPKDIEKACYFFANYQYLHYLKEYKTHKYLSLFTIKTFIITALSFFALVLILTNISINLANQNIIFLFSISYIIYILSFAYLALLDSEQERYFSYYLKDFPKRYFLESNNLDKEKEDLSKTSDSLSIVFGVLFTLYTTLSYNMIYTTNVNIKYIETNKTICIKESLK